MKVGLHLGQRLAYFCWRIGGKPRALPDKVSVGMRARGVEGVRCPRRAQIRGVLLFNVSPRTDAVTPPQLAMKYDSFQSTDCQ